jgi:hypothetical protein
MYKGMRLLLTRTFSSIYQYSAKPRNINHLPEMHISVALLLSMMAITPLARPSGEDNLAALCGTINGKFIDPLPNYALAKSIGDCSANGCAGDKSTNKVTCSAV